VWCQKWQVHLRHRPESGGAIVCLQKTGEGGTIGGHVSGTVLNWQAVQANFKANNIFLLPQAFPEGSPTTGHIHAGIHWRNETDTSIQLGEAVALRHLWRCPHGVASPCQRHGEVRRSADSSDERPGLGVQVEAELDVHLVRYLGERAQLRDDAFHRWPNTANRLFEGLPRPFNYLGALQTARHRARVMPGDVDEY
jgi:hypothetical protein